MKRKIFFIINPISGTRKRLKARIPEFIATHLNEDYDFAIKYTESKGHARELAREAVKNGFDVIAVAGGDGSVNEVASALINTKAALAILPLGSGNGLARHLKYPLNIPKALEVINKMNIQKIDLCEYNKLVFCSTAGLGFDAYVAKLFSRDKVRGLYSYARNIFRAVFQYPFFHYSLTTDGLEITGEAFLITVFNANQYGYNFRVARQADLQDGLLDVFIVNKFPKWKAFMLMGEVLSGMQEKSKYFQLIKAKSITIHTEKRLHFQIDGESVPKEKQVQINIIPEGLNILIP